MKKLLGFFGIKTEKELMGKTIKVSFYHSLDEVNYNFFFTVFSFTLDKNQLSFPPIPFGQGGYNLQISILWNGYHISLNHMENNEQEGYYTNCPDSKSTVLRRGKVELLN